MSTTAATAAAVPEPELRRRRTITWVVLLGFAGLLFDGYDLVVYGTLVPGFLRDPSQLGPVTPALAGAIGSYALAGTLVGAILAGLLVDIVGRRRMLLAGYLWCPVTMGITAFTSSTGTFGLMRFVAGIGIGVVIAVTGAVIAEFAPPGKKNTYSAIAYAGVGTGGVLAAVLAILLLRQIGWQGMLLIGAVPLVVLLPLAWAKLPESPVWLLSRGRVDDARAMAERTGSPLAEGAPRSPASSRQQAGFASLFRREHLWAVVLFAAVCLLVQVNVAVLQVWLPELMTRAGFSTQGSLSFLIALNGGAVVGALLVSRIADRIGAKLVVAGQLLLGAGALWLVTFPFPIAVLLVLVAFVGLGAGGVVNLLYGFMANYFHTHVRGAGLAWGTSWGRLGNIVGPLALGVLVGTVLALNAIFYTLAAIALIAMILTLLVPRTPPLELESVPVQPTVVAADPARP